MGYEACKPESRLMQCRLLRLDSVRARVFSKRTRIYLGASAFQVVNPFVAFVT